MFFCSQRKCSGLSCSRVLISGGIFLGWCLGHFWQCSGLTPGGFMLRDPSWQGLEAAEVLGFSRETIVQDQH